jgi:hypothetical protein
LLLTSFLVFVILSFSLLFCPSESLFHFLSSFLCPFIFLAVASSHDDVTKEYIQITAAENPGSYCQHVNLFEQN